MDYADLIARDIGRKCADDVSRVIHRNFQLISGQRDRMIVAAYAAAAAVGAVGGAMNAWRGVDADMTPASADELWQTFIRPMILGELSSGRNQPHDQQP